MPTAANRLAVRLCPKQSLPEHPASMTHAGLSPAHRAGIGIGENLVRLSVGVENARDIIRDIEQALERV